MICALFDAGAYAQAHFQVYLILILFNIIKRLNEHEKYKYIYI